MPEIPGVPKTQGPQGRKGIKEQIGGEGSQGMLGPRVDRGLKGPQFLGRVDRQELRE